jgi:hypothetical protein
MMDQDNTVQLNSDQVRELKAVKDTLSRLLKNTFDLETEFALVEAYKNIVGLLNNVPKGKEELNG